MLLSLICSCSPNESLYLLIISKERCFPPDNLLHLVLTGTHGARPGLLLEGFVEAWSCQRRQELVRADGRELRARQKGRRPGRVGGTGGAPVHLHLSQSSELHAAGRPMEGRKSRVKTREHRGMTGQK